MRIGSQYIYSLISSLVCSFFSSFYSSKLLYILEPPNTTQVIHCIPLTQFFRDTLRQFRVSPGKKLHPLTPRSSLVGRNHQALVDSHQARAIADVLDWLLIYILTRNGTQHSSQTGSIKQQITPSNNLSWFLRMLHTKFVTSLLR